MKSTRVLIAIVPLFNEALGLRQFHVALVSQEQKLAPMGWSLKVLYVDDGSKDATPEILRDLAICDPRVRFLSLSRNFGTQAAMCAGIQAADPDVDAVVMLDGDGQHPIDLIPEMVSFHTAGIDIVRTSRIDDENAGSRYKRWLSVQFHFVWAKVTQIKPPMGATDFVLFGPSVLRALQQFNETHRYLRGLITLVGFNSLTIPIRMLPRGHGTTKFTLARQIRLASDGILSFSTLPLRLCLLPGLLFVCAALVEGAAMIWRLMFGIPIAAGWTSLMIILLLGFGCTMLLLAVAGLYIGKIFEQVKNRPLYVIRSDSRHSEGSFQPVTSPVGASSSIGGLEDADILPTR